MTLWDVERGAALGEPLDGHTNFVSSFAFSPNGSTLASVDNGTNGTVGLWERTLASTDFSTWQKRLCGVVRQNLTEQELRFRIPGRPYEKTCPQFG